MKRNWCISQNIQLLPVGGDAGGCHDGCHSREVTLLSNVFHLFAVFCLNTRHQRPVQGRKKKKNAVMKFLHTTDKRPFGADRYGLDHGWEIGS